MRAARNTTKVFSFLTRARALYPALGIEKDKEFMKLIGLSNTSYKNWYSYGIKSIYWKMLDSLERNQRLTEELQKEKIKNQS